MLSKLNTVGNWYQSDSESGWFFDEITFDQEAIASFSELDLEIQFQAHSALVKTGKNHAYIPSNYFLYALKLQPLAQLLNLYMDVFGKLKGNLSSCELAELIASPTITNLITNKLDQYSRDNFFAVLGDKSARLAAKSIINGSGDDTKLRNSDDFVRSILLKAIPVPDASSEMLGKVIYAFSQSISAFEVLANKYSMNIPYLFQSDSGDDLLFQILSTLGWQGKLDSIIEQGTAWGEIEDAFRSATTPVVGNANYVDDPVHYSEVKMEYYFIKKGLLTTPDSINMVSDLVSKLWLNMQLIRKDAEFLFCSSARSTSDLAPFLLGSSGTAKNGTNKIYYGAPGTGKSHTINNQTSDRTKVVTVFHPDTQYNDFVGALKPRMSGSDITYEFRPGPFTKALLLALNKPEEHFQLIIEEINRAPAAAVFGELFQLLDRKEGGRSQYTIDAADPDMLGYINTHLNSESIDKLYIPENLSLLATMNSSDQAVMPLDTAFKRRWSFEYLKIDFKNPEVPRQTLTLKTADSSDWNISWVDFADTRCSSFSIPLPSNSYLHPAEQYFNDAVGPKRPKSLPIICFPDGIS
ncbi:hypothetical protein BJAS_P4425 [Bathymodiolus japonicus methanotrophic gill symbiont]|uniref:McrB family protein n=1 Tax=Bathymodiolus japonicus methanotrophic gill symbiont TaxID=113269 RepID=UPI001B779688|nr:AAA family ATPase [Bathymodiolus japonicus methanotrophic gill symbiont]GFO73562.1 hypothetical protein BJAS_P4425 [Bathymodiolus japonicus methanotrophic gill symbiont]